MNRGGGKMASLAKIHDALRDKSNPVMQFIKYVFCGGMSVAVDMAVFYLLAWLAFPCLQPGDPAGRQPDGGARGGAGTARK